MAKLSGISVLFFCVTALMHAQKNKELELQKEVLIKDHKTTLNLNIATYNKVLKIFGSTSELPSYNKKDDAEKCEKEDS